MDAEQFSLAGRRLYGRHGWQTELAEKLGIDRTTVWRYAKGHRSIPESVTLALEALQTRQSEVVFIKAVMDGDA
jgi:transcriptional regulator with XRE-family HTH domain